MTNNMRMPFKFHDYVTHNDRIYNILHVCTCTCKIKIYYLTMRFFPCIIITLVLFNSGKYFIE